MDFDVVIIGSGPAGCCAALTCIQKGLNVIIISGNKYKPVSVGHGLAPSESIHPGVVSLLAYLNAAHCIEAASRGIYEGIESGMYYNALGADENGPWQGHHINREAFDAALLQTAKERGVKLVEHDPVATLLCIENRITGVVTKAGKHLSGRFVIDASGHKRIAGKTLGFKETFYSPPLAVWTGLCAGVPVETIFPKQNYTRFIPHTHGWTWLAPEPGNYCSWTRMEVKGRQQFNPPSMLRDFQLASEIVKSNRRWRLFRPVCKEGLLLCGDAAGILDPAAGQGILNALVSSARAAHTIFACILNPEFEALYLAKYDDWFTTGYLEKVDLLKHFYKQHGVELSDSSIKKAGHNQGPLSVKF